MKDVSPHNPQVQTASSRMTVGQIFTTGDTWCEVRSHNTGARRADTSSRSVTFTQEEVS